MVRDTGLVSTSGNLLCPKLTSVGPNRLPSFQDRGQVFTQTLGLRSRDAQVVVTEVAIWIWSHDDRYGIVSLHTSGNQTQDLNTLDG